MFFLYLFFSSITVCKLSFDCMPFTLNSQEGDDIIIIENKSILAVSINSINYKNHSNDMENYFSRKFYTNNFFFFSLTVELKPSHSNNVTYS